MKATRTCSIEGCDRKHLARGWCYMHYCRWRDHGDPTYQREYPDTCTIDGCDKPHVARGWCRTHYARWKNHGEPGPAGLIKTRDNRCSVEGCDRRLHGGGYCAMHYQRLQKHGDPETRLESVPPTHHGADNPQWVGDEAKYAIVHKRVKRARGVASTHRCVGCGDPAVDWAYDNQDPNELVDERGLRYSLDLDHYQPMCKACHSAFDRAERDRRGWRDPRRRRP